ncbi:hypothetical protein [Limoniibacter endophyticus]|uniref:Uncharacterized protein n=2 Tax=Limoniibacter endophyticus TaxID=1565040 RepID=A0A8J3GIU4_9HYPH|nr:hypothetical protein [Limoniibacter endophyticus]GHC74175.1 hypothetical protein GCM10010136_23100 [Limoniibacter endophyticus]
MVAQSAFAACPVELAVYKAERGEVSLEFTPGEREAAVSNRFRLLYPDNAILEGLVLWTEPVPRPVGLLMKNCPEGDTTGDELAACTPWRGTIYGVSKTGNISLLPRQGEGAAPEKLLLPDLEMALHQAERLGGAEAPKAPGDVFVLTGCQE